MSPFTICERAFFKAKVERQKSKGFLIVSLLIYVGGFVGGLFSSEFGELSS